MSSLSARLLLSVSLLLLVFFGATIVVLDVAFREAGERSQEDILDGQLMALLAAAEPDDGGELVMPPDLPEPRLGTIGSGLYAELGAQGSAPVWRSRSSLGLHVPFPAAPQPGNHVFSRIQLADGTPLMALSLSVEWELPSGEFRPYTFNVAESLDSFNAQVAAFRRQLFGWFAAVALIMLLAISLVMRGLLRPLRQIEEEIGEIEEGRRQALSEGLPTELDSVARNMNLLISSERGRSDRYRTTLDNLAHSLKTPLAAIRAVLSEQPGNDVSRKIETQIERMNDIVRYQLRKPALLVSDSFGVTSVAIEEQLRRLVDGLSKVYKDKNPAIELDVDPRAEFRGDTGDFLELSGNLVDNACKWCRSRVLVAVTPLQGGGMCMTVGDDGPGIPEKAAELLLQRGMRLDESTPGHGIGLAVVKDIARSHGGDIQFGRSPLGGAEIRITIPGQFNK
ncbi:MAG: ATP-binding protein [Gammaproteobacteria bacterium]|nr:ATP-binding protein [Gammaproteobacteria bacterium]MDH4254856.1 ATP-binding protein [Gammaproteobacteria bacterium]MDH5310188.1 ATP-binding protein [Gammaproteobacteria bacterium]